MSKKIESLYIHVPFCKHLCNYCDFYKKKPTESDGFAQFEQLLDDSWGKHQNLLAQYDFEISKLKSIYFGGGTPSLWGFRGIRYLENFFVKNELKFSDDYEFTIEIDPATTTKDEILAWKNLGVNRFSVGLQTWDEEYLKIIDRVHTKSEAINLLSVLSQLGVNFTVDFMIGFPIPIKRKRDIVNELTEILSFSPKHISLYILSVAKSYPLFKSLPQDDEVAREYLQVSQFLNQNGFEHYEVSNHARPGFRSRHNQQYWQQFSVAALGPSATGFLKLKNRAIRYKWRNKTANYSIEELNKEAIDLEKLYTNLRTIEGIDISLLPKSASHLADEWETKGLGIKSKDRLSLTPSGYVVLDSLMDEIFRYS